MSEVSRNEQKTPSALRDALIALAIAIPISICIVVIVLERVTR